MAYYHGSYHKLNIGNSIVPNLNGYTHAESVNEIEQLFEDEKPDHIQCSRLNCIFMTDNPEDIDNAGGFNDYVYLVQPSLPVEKSDLSWYTKAWCQLADNDIAGARISAKKYWNGDALEKVYEYRASNAIITKILD